jgi:PAS domain S-box-containing protein
MHAPDSDTSSPVSPDCDILTNPERLRALRRYKVIGTPQAHLDRFTRLVTQLYEAPIGLLTLLGDERQHFVAKKGTDLDGVPARPAVCRATVAKGEPLVVENLAADPRFSGAYYVTGDLDLRFYAGAPMTTSDGHPIGTLCVYDTRPRSPDPTLKTHLRDLADMAMEALERDQFAYGDQPELNQTVLDHLPGIFYVLGPDGRLRKWNSRFEALSGLSADEVEGRPGTDFFRGDDRARVEAAIEQGFEAGSVTVEANFAGKSDEETPMLLTGVRTRLRGEPRLVGMGIDISERRQRERELRAAKEEAERLRRRAEEASRSKSYFLRGVAHDLRAPISSVELTAAALTETLGGENAERAWRIRRALKQVEEMADMLTELARLDSGELDLEKAPVAVGPLVEAVADDLRPAAREGDIELVVEAEAVWGRAHESSLRRALLNLGENAVAYSAAGDTVTLRAHIASSTPETVVLAVDDTGPGIDPDFQDRLFDPFARDAPDTEGSGLGLTVTKELVEAMDGTIDVESTLGDGTTIRIHLPAAEPVDE